MARVANFYSTAQVKIPPEYRVYHNDDACLIALDIPDFERRPGTNGYLICNHCEMLERLSEAREKF